MIKEQFDLIISIVCYNSGQYLVDLIDSLLKAKENLTGKLKIICVDNLSIDGSKELLNKFQCIEKIFFNENLGFGAAHNYVMKNFDAKYYLLLNPDTLFDDELNLQSMIEYMESKPEIALATCALTSEEHLPISAIAHKPTLLNALGEQLRINRYLRSSRILKKAANKLKTIFPVILNNFVIDIPTIRNTKEVEYIYGAYLLIRKSAINEIGMFDEHFFLFWEEIDLCIRTRSSGYKVGFNGKTSIIHYSQQSQSSAPEFSYYWLVASYFWIFQKHYYPKFILFCLLSIIVQLLFVSYQAIMLKKKWFKIHFSLLMLAITFGMKYESMMKEIKSWHSKQSYGQK